MAMDFIPINNYNRLGQMGISRLAIRTIALKAVYRVPGAAVYVNPPSKVKAKAFIDGVISDLFSLPNGVNVTLSKDGIAKIHIDVEFKEGTNASELAKSIQKEVGESLAMMCEAIPYEVGIRIARIVA